MMQGDRKIGEIVSERFEVDALLIGSIFNQAEMRENERDKSNC
jgi:hypothetical protein